MLRQTMAEQPQRAKHGAQQDRMKEGHLLLQTCSRKPRSTSTEDARQQVAAALLTFKVSRACCKQVDG